MVGELSWKASRALNDVACFNARLLRRFNVATLPDALLLSFSGKREQSEDLFCPLNAVMLFVENIKTTMKNDEGGDTFQRSFEKQKLSKFAH